MLGLKENASLVDRHETETNVHIQETERWSDGRTETDGKPKLSWR